ncbi:hypothetical protein GBA52_013723 [Prunus armeniaca]|nr:hypothetical protein GBA52_013723 [Prunus armeniaca]
MSNETGGESAVPAGAFREFLKPNSGVQLSFKRQRLTSFSNDTENMPLDRTLSFLRRWMVMVTAAEKQGHPFPVTFAWKAKENDD